MELATSIIAYRNAPAMPQYEYIRIANLIEKGINEAFCG